MCMHNSILLEGGLRPILKKQTNYVWFDSSCLCLSNHWWNSTMFKYLSGHLLISGKLSWHLPGTFLKGFNRIKSLTISCSSLSESRVVCWKVKLLLDFCDTICCFTDFADRLQCFIRSHSLDNALAEPVTNFLSQVILNIIANTSSPVNKEAPFKFFRKTWG